MTARNLGKALCIAAGVVCALLHVATFLAVVPSLLILVPFFLLGGRSSLLKIGAGLEALRLPSQSTYRAHRQSGYSGLGYAPLCNSPVCSFLQEFGRSDERRNR